MVEHLPLWQRVQAVHCTAAMPVPTPYQNVPGRPHVAKRDESPGRRMAKPKVHSWHPVAPTDTNPPINVWGVARRWYGVSAGGSRWLGYAISGHRTAWLSRAVLGRLGTLRGLRRSRRPRHRPRRSRHTIVSQKMSDPPTDNRATQIRDLRSLLDAGVIDWSEYERRRHEIHRTAAPSAPPPDEVVIRYQSLRRFALGVIVLVGIGIFFAWATTYSLNADNWVRAIEATFAGFAFLLAGSGLLTTIRIWRSSDPPLVINQEGIDMRMPLRGRFRVPWNEVEAARVKEFEGENVSSRSIEIRLRGPLGRFRVPPRAQHRFSRAQGRLVLSDTMFDISNDRLLELIQAHLDVTNTGIPAV